jgi:hypothetical protein
MRIKPHSVLVGKDIEYFLLLFRSHHSSRYYVVGYIGRVDNIQNEFSICRLSVQQQQLSVGGRGWIGCEN